MTPGFDLCVLSLGIWLYILLGRGMFWLARERNRPDAPAPARWPAVTAVVPARNEADVISKTVGSLLRQDYPGPFQIVLVDDQSTDGTAALARTPDCDLRLHVVSGKERPKGWTGKLWAVAQGIDHAKSVGSSDYLWLTDADIVHDPVSLRVLVARAEFGRLVLVSEMAKLHCRTFAERLLIPAFVYFFDMLYPFAWVNDPRSPVSAAAGGSMLVRRAELELAGGIAAIRNEIIDDCALARLMKKRGPIWLGLTELARSVRPYDRIADIAQMVSRSAYAQLRYSPLWLAGTLVGMSVLYAAPLLALVRPESAMGAAGLGAWLAMAVSFQPMLRFYRLSPLWGLALPAIGLIYAAFTLDSAWQSWRGRGGIWKGRVQAISKA